MLDVMALFSYMDIVYVEYLHCEVRKGFFFFFL